MSGTIYFYISSVSSNMEIKKQQQRIDMVLESKKIPFIAIDIAASDEEKQKMRELAGNPSALPPQLCNGNEYCGDYNAFDDALEGDTLEEFLKLK
eukprot:gene286-912_t